MFADNSHWPLVVNLSNGIIGVSVLAMPFCLERCGVVLGLLLLIASAIFTTITCNLLIEGAHLCKKSSYEHYAAQVFGNRGKIIVEISMILYTKATLIAFFIVIGDLGQNIFAPLFLPSSSGELLSNDYATFRLIFTTIFAFLVILPMCLLKNVKSLSIISSLAILFYFLMILRFLNGGAHNLLVQGSWKYMHFWRWEGLLQCLPIFSMSLSCQTQLFIISNEIPDTSPAKMNIVISRAVILCSFVYFSIGFFGYASFYRESPLPGDIMVLLNSTFDSQLIKLGFLLSVAVSYPIMIFPCRAAVYSMIKGQLRREKSLSQISLLESDIDEHNIPDSYAKSITTFLIVSNLIISIILPNMELILGLSGSLIGSTICFILPALLYLKAIYVYDKKTKDHSRWKRKIAQICLVVGLLMFVFCTYVTLVEHEKEYSFADTSDSQALEVLKEDTRPKRDNVESLNDSSNFSS